MFPTTGTNNLDCSIRQTQKQGENQKATDFAASVRYSDLTVALMRSLETRMRTFRSYRKLAITRKHQISLGNVSFFARERGAIAAYQPHLCAIIALAHQIVRPIAAWPVLANQLSALPPPPAREPDGSETDQEIALKSEIHWMAPRIARRSLVAVQASP